MKNIQMFLSVAAGKALIAKALLARADVRHALENNIVVFVTGTTNAYLAKAALDQIGDSDGFDMSGFFRGVVTPPGSGLKSTAKHDIVIEKGKWLRDMDVYSILPRLTKDDIIFKGANVINLETREAGILVGNPEFGTLAPISVAVGGRRTKLIVAAGVEKRTSDPVHRLAYLANLPESEGLRLGLAPGELFTELDAIKLLSGADATVLASGGVRGYEGGCYFFVSGTDEQLEVIKAIHKDVAQTEPY